MGERFEGDRWAYVIALRKVAVDTIQPCKRLGTFDAFRGHLHAKAAAETDHGMNDCGSGGEVVDAAGQFRAVARSH